MNGIEREIITTEKVYFNKKHLKPYLGYLVEVIDRIAGVITYGRIQDITKEEIVVAYERDSFTYNTLNVLVIKPDDVLNGFVTLLDNKGESIC